MGFITELINILGNISDTPSYIDDAKKWGDEIWTDAYYPLRGSLTLQMVDRKLYKKLRIVFRRNTVATYTDDNDYGWMNYERTLNKAQQNELEQEGEIIIKKY